MLFCSLVSADRLPSRYMRWAYIIKTAASIKVYVWAYFISPPFIAKKSDPSERQNTIVRIPAAIESGVNRLSVPPTAPEAFNIRPSNMHASATPNKNIAPKLDAQQILAQAAFHSLFSVARKNSIAATLKINKARSKTMGMYTVVNAREVQRNRILAANASFAVLIREALSN